MERQEAHSLDDRAPQCGPAAASSARVRAREQIAIDLGESRLSGSSPFMRAAAAVNRRALTLDETGRRNVSAPSAGSPPGGMKGARAEGRVSRQRDGDIKATPLGGGGRTVRRDAR